MLEFWVPFAVLFSLVMLLVKECSKLRDLAKPLRQPYTTNSGLFVFWSVVIPSSFMVIIWKGHLVQTGPMIQESAVMLLGMSALTTVTALENTSELKLVSPKPRKSPGRLFRIVLGKIFAVTISVVIALFIGEGIIRLLYKNKMVLFPRYHTDASYGNFKIRRIRPDISFVHQSVDGTFHFSTNDKGFRNNANIPYAKKDKEIRIICVGDSHTQGYEVNQDETFSSIAEKNLKDHGIDATVINAGVSGFSTEEEITFLENEGYKYKPDYVVLGFFANDFEDNMRCSIFDLENDSLVIKSHEYLPGVSIQNMIYRFRLFKFLGEHSYLYGYAFNTIWDLYKGRDVEQVHNTEYAIATKSSYSEVSQETVRKLITRLHNWCAAKHIKLVVLDIPNLSNNDSPVSSIPKDLEATFKENCDKLFYYNDLASEYNRLPMTHVPHGHRHISKYSHNLLGKKIAEYVINETNTIRIKQ